MFASLLRDRKNFECLDKPFAGLYMGESWVSNCWVLRSFVTVLADNFPGIGIIFGGEREYLSNESTAIDLGGDPHLEEDSATWDIDRGT